MPGAKGEMPVYPLIPFRVELGGRLSKEWEALVDSGADGTIFPKDFADFYDLPRTGSDDVSIGLGGKALMYPTRLRVLVGRGGRMDDLGIIEARVFKKDSDIPIIFGRRPLFERYQILFKERDSKVQLITY